MEFLVFQLQGAMAAWGGPAVGEFRGSVDYPGESSLVGLIGAALGIRRGDEAAHAALAQGYGFAVAVQAASWHGRRRLLRDYHTVQVPSRADLKGRPHATRRDELNLPKNILNTILSTRDYWQDSASLVALQPRAAPPYSLERLAQALLRPRFVLYLGRKSCPPSVPLYPQVVTAADAYAAFQAYLDKLSAGQAAAAENGDKPTRFHAEIEATRQIVKLAWSDGVASGVQETMCVQRKDRLLRRGAWQFGDRAEHIAILDREE